MDSTGLGVGFGEIAGRFVSKIYYFRRVRMYFVIRTVRTVRNAYRRVLDNSDSCALLFEQYTIARALLRV